MASRCGAGAGPRGWPLERARGRSRCAPEGLPPSACADGPAPRRGSTIRHGGSGSTGDRGKAGGGSFCEGSATPSTGKGTGLTERRGVGERWCKGVCTRGIGILQEDCLWPEAPQAQHRTGSRQSRTKCSEARHRKQAEGENHSAVSRELEGAVLKARSWPVGRI